jgi:hypothetical protein
VIALATDGTIDTADSGWTAERRRHQSPRSRRAGQGARGFGEQEGGGSRGRHDDTMPEGSYRVPRADETDTGETLRHPFRSISTVSLNPAQQRVIELLGKGSEREPLPAELAEELFGELQGGLEPVRELIEHKVGAELYIGKRDLAQIHGCEAHYVADHASEFSWTPAAARGVVSHKAIELLINWRGEPVPATLVDEGIARLCDGGKGVANYLEALTEAERAELRGFATDRVTKFLECFPQPKPQWRPTTESSVIVELFDGALKLAGKTDLTLGKPGSKVIIDLKSGGSGGPHREDLRWYALLETVRLGVPPRMVATYYIDQGRPHPEDVTEPVLWAAVRRAVDGITRIVEIERGGSAPAIRPGFACRWCPLNTTCEPGIAHLAGVDSDVEIEP